MARHTAGVDVMRVRHLPSWLSLALTWVYVFFTFAPLPTDSFASVAALERAFRMLISGGLLDSIDNLVWCSFAPAACLG